MYVRAVMGGLSGNRTTDYNSQDLNPPLSTWTSLERPSSHSRMASTPIAVICLATGWSGFNVDIGSTGVLPNTSSGELGEWCSSASSLIPVGIRLAAEG